MQSSRTGVKQPRVDDATIAPVTILDAEGRVVRVVPAVEFQRAAAAARARAESGAPDAPMKPGPVARPILASAIPRPAKVSRRHLTLVGSR